MVKSFLHNLHGQFSGFHSFIFKINSSKLLLFLIWSSTISKILRLKTVQVSIPLYTNLTLFFLNSVFFCFIIKLCIFHKDSVHKISDNSLFTFNNSVANNWISLSYIVVELLTFSRSSVNEDA